MSRLLDRFVNVVNRHSPVLIQVPWPKNIGNCAEEMRYGLLKAQREGKRTLFVFHRHELFGRLHVPIANRELFLLESEDLIHSTSVLGSLAGWILTAVYALIRPWILLWVSEKLRRVVARIVPWVSADPRPRDFNPNETMPLIGTPRLWRPDGVTMFSWEVVERLNWREQYARYRPPRLAEAKRRSAERIRVEMGIPLGDWFVALHVRDAPGGKHRNSSIDNYLDAIRVITGEGGWVVRLGDTAMPPLRSMERVIDYAHSRWKSELMDLYLISECRFYLGTTSGPYDAAVLLGRPVLTVNAHDCGFWGPMGGSDLAILKHVYSRRLRRVLSVREVLEEPFEINCVDSLSDSQDYELIENSPDEIRAVVEEFMRPGRRPKSDLQLAFNAARSLVIHRWLDGGHPKGLATDREGHATEQYRIASRADSVAGALGQQYLDKNWAAVPQWLTDRTMRTACL